MYNNKKNNEKDIYNRNYQQQCTLHQKKLNLENKAKICLLIYENI